MVGKKTVATNCGVCGKPTTVEGYVITKREKDSQTLLLTLCKDHPPYLPQDWPEEPWH